MDVAVIPKQSEQRTERTERTERIEHIDCLDLLVAASVWCLVRRLVRRLVWLAYTS